MSAMIRMQAAFLLMFGVCHYKKSLYVTQIEKNPVEKEEFEKKGNMAEESCCCAVYGSASRGDGTRG